MCPPQLTPLPSPHAVQSLLLDTQASCPGPALTGALAAALSTGVLGSGAQEGAGGLWSSSSTGLSGFQPCLQPLGMGGQSLAHKVVVGPCILLPAIARESASSRPQAMPAGTCLAQGSLGVLGACISSMSIRLLLILCPALLSCLTY